MPRFSLTLLGGFRLEDEDGTHIPVASRKTQGMLAVLALQSPAAVTRERMAAIFWGDLSEDRARHSLRQALSAVRRDASIIERDVLERAVAMYSGVFLDGLTIKTQAFEEWVHGERARLAKAAAGAMMRLAAQQAALAEHESAECLLRRLLDFDPMNEEGHRALMRSLESQGRRSEALAHYHACRDLLSKRLQIEPDAATQALYGSLRKAEAARRGAEGRGCIIAVMPLSNFARTP